MTPTFFKFESQIGFGLSGSSSLRWNERCPIQRRLRCGKCLMFQINLMEITERALAERKYVSHFVFLDGLRNLAALPVSSTSM